MSLVVRGIAVWFFLLIGAIVNGAVRQAWLVPLFGEFGGHVASTVSLALLILAVGWTLSGWLDLATVAESWLLGAVWLVLTVAFEFVGGYFLFAATWSMLLEDYNLLEGRTWLLVLATALLTPRLIHRLERRRATRQSPTRG